MIAKISYCLVCFNQEQFIIDALKSALNQNVENLEIIISDDCSTDNTFIIIQEYLKDYNGKHKIILNKNEENYGFIRHLNKVINELASGEIILLAAGDDISLPIRTANTIAIFQKYHNIQAVTSQQCVINNKGVEQRTKSKTKSEPKIYNLKLSMGVPSFMLGGVALSFRKSLFNYFGPLSEDCPTEDSTIRNRALLLGEVFESEAIWSYYRIHENNMSAPGNIHKLKTSKIGKQLLIDINTCYRDKLLNGYQKCFLKFKVSVWAINNFLAIKSYSSSNVTREIIKYLLKAISIFYKTLYIILFKRIYK